MSRDFDDDVLSAADDVAASELTAATTARPLDGRLEVRIGDLAVVYTPDEQRRRGRSYAVIVAAAAAIVLVVVLVVVLAAGLVRSGAKTRDRLAVSPAPPMAKTSAQPHRNATAPAVVHPPDATASSVARAVVPAGPPPAPLSVTMSLSATTVQAGGSITVNYSWTDGNGRLLYLNEVGVSAVKVVRPPPCTSTPPAPKPSSGHGSWIFSLPPQGQPALIDGLSLPFDHPERIKVGVQIGTGAKCVPLEEKTVTQWVTIYPPG